MQAVKSGAPPDAPSRPGGAASNPKRTAQGQQKKNIIHYPFWFGGSASSLAACVTHPLDLVKVRLQMRTGDMPRSMTGTFVHVLKHNGPSGLYSGLSASLLRQMTYSTTRFGIYEELKRRATSARDGRQPSFPVLVALASASGLVGGIAGNPADVINVRMQHDAALPAAQRRNYAHAIDGLVRMAREEGGSGSLLSKIRTTWFRGVWPNSVRAAAMTAGQLASYDAVKRLLVATTPMRDDALTTHLSASFLAGVAAATITSPIDVVKTRVMSATASQRLVGVLGELYRAEGLRWMFKGWVPSFLRLGPQTICTFIFLEFHRKAYKKMKGLDE